MGRRDGDLTRSGYGRITRRLAQLLESRNEDDPDVDGLIEELGKREQQEKIVRFKRRLGEQGE